MPPVPPPSSAIRTGIGARGPITWRAVPLEEADREFDFQFW